jgi:hypothetical protein
LRIAPERAVRFKLRVRIPSWAEGATLAVGEESTLIPVAAGSFAEIERVWREGDEVLARFPMRPRLQRALNRNVQESRVPDGSLVRQQVLRQDYVGVLRGPLSYATGLIDGFKTEETLRLPATPSGDWLKDLPPVADDDAPRIELRPERRDPIVFLPYFRAGGRADGSWRLSWMSLAPDQVDEGPDL